VSVLLITVRFLNAVISRQRKWF